MKSNRSKGIDFVREVKKILEGIGHVCDGPFYKSTFFNGQVRPVHTDLFNAFDLCSYYNGLYFFHQVSTIAKKSVKIKALQDKKLPGWVWCRVCNGKVFYRIFVVSPGESVEEQEIRWKA